MIIRSDRMREEVEKHPEVLAEAYQVYLRAQGVEDAYEIVQKALERGWSEVAEALKKNVPGEVYERLRRIKASEYIGESIKIARYLLEEVEKVLGDVKSMVQT